MAEVTGIEWTDHTFNPWTGCAKVSPGCDHCYAEALAKRAPATFGSWQPGAARKRTSDAYWRQPLAWDRKAARDGVRRRVFCASMADVFDNQARWEWRRDLFELVWNTPRLDWLLLTKRPQNIARMLPDAEVPGIGRLDRRWPWPNVWLGTTVENQEEADRRIPALLAAPAAVRFLSCEPLLGPVDLRRHLIGHETHNMVGEAAGATPPLDWVIAGGESGPQARPSHPDWHRSLRDQCAEAGVPFFFKQWGEWAYTPGRGDVAIHVSGVVERGGIRANQVPPSMRDFGTWKGMSRVGKKTAGALLDGREHREVPA